MQQQEIGNGQKALWTFLAYLLLGPFFASLLVAAAMLLAPPLQLAALLPAGLPPLGVAAAATFVWTVLPAGLAALIVMPIIFRRSQFGWIEAAVAGVVAFAAVAAFSNMPHRDILPVLGFAAGLISLAVRSCLIAGGIIKMPE